MKNLNKALNKEIHSLELYTRACEINPIFKQICEIKQNHIELLKEFSPKAELKKSYDESSEALNGDFAENLDFFIFHENSNINFYNSLIKKEKNDSLKDLFYLFQAHSFNEILPILQGLNSMNSQQIFDEINKTKEFFNEAALTLNKLENKNLSQAELEGFLKRLNFSLLGGAVLGMAAMFAFNEISNQHTKD